MRTFYRVLLLSTCIGLLTPLLTACSSGSASNQAAIEARKAQFQKLKPNLSLPLINRVQRMPVDLIEANQTFDKSIGISSEPYQPRAATGDELALIKSYIALLPPVLQTVLADKLLGFYLVDNFPGGALTDWVVDGEGRVYYYMVFNSAQLTSSVDDWLSLKDNSPFDDSNTTLSIKVQTQTPYKALLYGLLHEGAHVLDYEQGLTPYVDTLHKYLKNLKLESTAFTAGVWINQKTPKAEYDFAHRSKMNFYRIFPNLKLIPRAEMPKLFAQLKQTPFVSFYSGSSWNEHLADYVAYYHIEKKLGGSITLQLLNQGKVIDSYAPLKTPNAQRLDKTMAPFYQ